MWTYVKFMMAAWCRPIAISLPIPVTAPSSGEHGRGAPCQVRYGAAWELRRLIARRWDFRPQDVRMAVSLWQGLADQILPAPMARRLVAALPACNPRYFPAEGHLSLIVRHISEALAQLRS